LIYPRVFAALLLSGGMASVAVAAPPVMLNDALITQISKADRASFHEAVAQALNSSADGQSTEWKSAHQPKRAAPITVQLTPKQTTRAGNDRVCRFLVGNFARTSTTETWQFWFCKQPDGTWKASAN
jgi:surface antigen